MAGTIISTPALGASDWSTWITQQGRTDRGFMRLSLTNFSATTASTIATGGVMECAGSIYQFTNTSIILATGTASASVAVYFYVIPSAGGTVCTISMDSTAPTWVDAKQGFYASAASVTRAIGGCYIGTALVYYNKFIYSFEMLDYCLQQAETRPILSKIINIGEWNMDATSSVNIPHGLIYATIRTLFVLIRSDTDGQRRPFTHDHTGAGANGYITVNPTTFTLARKAGGYFDDTGHDGTASTVANRGWIFIEYEA